MRSLVRPSLILAAFTLGAFLPGAAFLTFLIRYFLMGMLFIIFLNVRFCGLKPGKTHCRILFANLLIGILAWGITLLSGDRILAEAAFFAAIAPTASAAPVIMGLLGGSTEFVVTSFLLTNAGIALSLTGLIPTVTGNFTFLFLGQVARSLLFTIGIPMLAAVLIRKAYPGIRETGRKLSGVSFLMWVCMLFLTASNASRFIRSAEGLSPAILWKIAAVSGIVCCVNFTVGYWIGEREFRRESSQSLGQKNTMLLLYAALAFSGPLPALGPTFYVLWHNLWNAVQMFLHDREKERKSPKAEQKP